MQTSLARVPVSPRAEKKKRNAWVWLQLRVMGETFLALVTMSILLIAVSLFVSGSQIIPGNVERAGVRLSRFIVGNEGYVSGSFFVENPCTRVDVLSEAQSTGESPATHVYLTENKKTDCALRDGPVPYTFTAPLVGGSAVPILMYINGDQITTVENN